MKKSNKVDIRVGDYLNCKDADIIIMTARPSVEASQTRLELAKENNAIMKTVMENISKRTRDAIILIATNPVDILTYIAAKSVDYEASKIIGACLILVGLPLENFSAVNPIAII